MLMRTMAGMLHRGCSAPRVSQRGMNQVQSDTKSVAKNTLRRMAKRRSDTITNVGCPRYDRQHDCRHN